MKFLLSFFVGYVYVILSQTVFPTIHMGFTETGEYYFDVFFVKGKEGLNLIPFKTLWKFGRNIAQAPSADIVVTAIINLVGNLALFIPLGILFPLAFPKKE